MMKRAIGIVASLALLAGCPKKDGTSSDAAASASPSAEAPATTTAPSAAQPVAPSASTAAKSPVKLPLVPIDAGPLSVDGGLALLADAGPLPTPSASGSAQPAAMPPECTQYLAKADACNAKRLPALQGPARAATAAQRAGWDALVKQGQAAAVVAQCKAAMSAIAADPACK